MWVIEVGELECAGRTWSARVQAKLKFVLLDRFYESMRQRGSQGPAIGVGSEHQTAELLGYPNRLTDWLTTIGTERWLCRFQKMRR